MAQFMFYLGLLFFVKQQTADEWRISDWSSDVCSSDLLAELKTALGDGAARLQTRPVAVEDLLGRSQAVLDRNAMRALVRDRRVLVTGAGGTIGGELVRQIAALDPAALILFDNAEYQLYQKIGRAHV